jgi:integrase
LYFFAVFDTLTHLKPIFGSLLLIDIRAEDVADYQKARAKAGASPKTINLEVGTLRAVLRRHRLWADMQPDVKMLKTVETVGRCITAEEELGLLDACRTRRSRVLLPIVTLALNTGMRRGEILSLRWQQVDSQSKILTVGASKTESGTNRVIPLNAPAMTTLENWAARFPARQPEHYVFPSEHYGLAGNDRKPHAKTVKPETPAGEFKKAWQSAKEAAGIDCRFHDLRHTACTRLLERGASFPVVAAIMGWSASTTAKMAQRYGHIGSDVQRNALNALDPSWKPPAAEKTKRRRGGTRSKAKKAGGKLQRNPKPRQALAGGAQNWAQ